MKPLPWLVYAVLALLANAAWAETAPVYVVPLKGEVSSAQFLFLRRALKEAERNHASAFVVDMNTYGGDVKAAIDNMDALLKTSVPTYTYINDKAISAGALITLATKSVYMAPGAVIGSAAPVSSSGQDLSQTMTEKTISTISAIARGAATKMGHNPDLADAFVRKSFELKIGSAVLDGPDSLLTLNADEAARKIDGKAVLAEGVAPSLQEMLHLAGLHGDVQRVEPTGFERLAGLLTTLAPLLLMGGIIGAFIEIKTPGFGIAGIGSTICFALFFSSSYLAGLAGWETFIVFLIGVVLIISELFVHPGVVLPGIVGFLLMIGSILWAMIDRYPAQGWWPTNEMLVVPLLNLVLAFALASIAIYFLARFLPKTSLYHRIVLGEVVPSSGNLRAGLIQTGVTVGMEGTAHTMLRPSGKAHFSGQLVDVVSQGDLINEGTALRILSVEGPRIVVAAR